VIDRSVQNVEWPEYLQVGNRDVMQALIPDVYEELKKLARAHLRRETGGCSLDATALVHEAFLKLARGGHPAYENLTHFYGIASRVMRQVLIDTARVRTAEKRGAAHEIALANLPDPAPRPDRILSQLRDALRQLKKTDPRKARLVEMRYFDGMTAEESSAALAMSVHTVRREIRLARSLLRNEISGHNANPVALSRSALVPIHAS